jgi:hypothetical protein
MSFTGYFQVMDEFTEVDPFKRLIAWKGLKIRSISILGSTITIECYKGRKTYFVTIDENEVKVFNNKKEVIDTIPIPRQYNYTQGATTATQSPWVTYNTGPTIASDPKWRSAGTTLDPSWTSTSSNTTASYSKEFKIDFE